MRKENAKPAVRDRAKSLDERFAALNGKDNALSSKNNGLLAPPPIASPSKPNGILMTPGTLRRTKSVTFGAQVVDNEGKRAGRISKSELPNTCPGKFPSPWTPKVGLDLASITSDGSRTKTKLTAKLEEVRDSVTKSKTGMVVKAKDDTDITLDMTEPRSHSGKYWKEKYESYAARTEKETRQLLFKHKSAKTYAKEKDDQALRLADHLRQEQRKVRRLEVRVAELETQLNGYREKLRTQDAVKSLDEKGNESAKITSGFLPDTSPTSSIRSRKYIDASFPGLDKALQGARANIDAASQSVGLQSQQTKQDHEQSVVKITQRSPTKKRAARNRIAVDPWLDAGLSSPLTTDAPEKPYNKPSSLQNKPTPSPLEPRDINILQTSASSQLAAPFRPNHELNRTPQTIDRNRGSGDTASQSKVDDSLDDMLNSLPQPSPAVTEPQSAPRSARSRRQAFESPTRSSPPPKYDRMALPAGTAPPPVLGQAGFTSRLRGSVRQTIRTLSVVEGEVEQKAQSGDAIASVEAVKENLAPVEEVGAVVREVAGKGAEEKEKPLAATEKLKGLDVDRLARAKARVKARQEAKMGVGAV